MVRFPAIYFDLHLYNALPGAYSSACWFTMMADAVDTERFIDDIGILSGRNSVYRAFWFAGSAKNASISNTMCHKIFFLV